MANTIRVTNIRKYPIGIALQNGREYNIRPGGFVLLGKDDIEWLASIAPALFAGERQLRLDDRELAVELGFIDRPENKPLDESEIQRCLGLSAAKLRQWLDTIDEPYLLDAVYTVAMQMDLSTSKLKVLQEKMPAYDFLPVDGA